jgi:hypothetical protein
MNKPIQQDSNYMPSNKKFGYFFSMIFTFSFIYSLFYSSQKFALFFFLLALIFIFLTIFTPSLLGPLNRIWFFLGLLLAKIFNPVILAIIFYFLITPVALVAHFFGRDILFIKKRIVTSYWVDRDSMDSDSFKNQF